MKTLVLCLVAATAWAAAVETLNAPVVKPGDTWTYRQTTEKATSGWSQSRDETTVTRVTPSSIYYTVKASGSTQPPKELFAGLDWSRVRDVNGKETTVARPLAFPLTVGKTWGVQYVEQHPNRAHKSEEFASTFTVVGYENVEVPAGRFNALKIESEGHWNAELAPVQTVVQGAQVDAGGASTTTQVQRAKEGTATGRLYKAFWYVPEVKRWVKSVEEYYGNGGVRNESYTGELESFRVE